MSCWFLCDPCQDAKTALINNPVIIGSGVGFVDMNNNGSYDYGIDAQLGTTQQVQIIQTTYGGDTFYWLDGDGDMDMDKGELLTNPADGGVCAP